MEDQSSNQKNNVDGAKEKLLAAGRSLFAHKGLDGTTTRDIAQLSGLNISLISYYFGGKEGLYKAVIQEFAEMASFEVGSIFDRHMNQLSAETFAKAMREFVTAIVEKNLNPNMQEVMMILERERVTGLPHSKEIHEKLFQEVVLNFCKLIDQAKALKLVRPNIRPEVTFLILVESVHGFSCLSRGNIDFSDRIIKLPEQKNELIEQVYELFYEGMKL